MKHDFKITIILVLFFLASQYVGLFITSQYITVEKVIDVSTGKETFNVTNVTDLPAGIERIDVSEDFSWLYIMFAILLGTVIVLVLVRFKQRRVWRFWYFFSLILIMTFALAPFMDNVFAFVLSAILSLFKTYKPNVVIHNLTEIFLYGGLAAMLVPIMNLYSVFMLLIVISVYDAIAVWKSKHMISLAKFQSDSNVFAGLFIPYTTGKKGKVLMKAESSKRKEDHKIKEISSKSHSKEAPHEKVVVNRAILGGGDIAFPLVFTGVVMKTAGFSNAALIPPFTALALFFLLYKSEKGKFYPAMPFISAGCILGFIFMYIVGILF